MVIFDAVQGKRLQIVDFPPVGSLMIPPSPSGETAHNVQTPHVEQIESKESCCSRDLQRKRVAMAAM